MIKEKVIKNIIRSNPISVEMYRKYRVKKYSNNTQLEDIIIYANSFCNAECSFCDVPRVY